MYDNHVYGGRSWGHSEMVFSDGFLCLTSRMPTCALMLSVLNLALYSMKMILFHIIFYIIVHWRR